MQTILAKTNNNNYNIYVGKNLIQRNAEWTSCLPSKQALIVTQEPIARHYLNKLKQALHPVECQEYFLPIGEQHKNLIEWQNIIDYLLKNNYKREASLIALGGGMVGDVTGFAAACYQRGMNYFQIPTTLMAQVDSAIGGKCGINHALGKNMIGVFYHPHGVVVDIDLLQSLPEKEYCSGLAEVIKYALIYDKTFFQYLETNLSKLTFRDDEVLIATICRCLEIKTYFVFQDETDHGLRQLLNFGHTFAHALENAYHYQTLLHGDAVAIGMVMAAYLSYERDLLLFEDLNQIIALLKNAGLLKQKLQSNINLYELMMRDKKNNLGVMNLILLQGIGKAIKVSDITKDEIEKAHLFFLEEVML